MQRAHGRLTKQEIKEDELMAWGMKTWGYVEQNYPKILAGLGAVVVLALVGVFIKHQSDRQAQAAIDALGDVRIALYQGRADDAILQAERVVEDYSGKPAAGYALLLMGNMYYELGRHTEAQTAYQRYLSDYGDEGPSGYGAWTGLAACLEEQQSFLEAAQKYAAYADKYASSPFAPIVLKEASRCYLQAQEFEKAQEVLERIVNHYSESKVARTARADLTEMGVVN